MNKKLLISFLFLLVALLSSSQTYNQRELLMQYFETSGVERLRKISHPDSPLKSKEIWVSNSSVYIKIYYGGYWSDFSDTYRIEVSSTGKFTELEVVSDGSTVFTAFNACDMARESFSDVLKDDYENTSSENRNTLNYIEAAVGKAASKFSCKDICLFRLYKDWKEKGYYSRY